MSKPTCPVCDGEMIWDISADAARYICLWSEKQPEMHAQLAAAVAERDALRAALWDARNEVVEFCANFDIPLEHDSYLDLAVKLDEWAELAGGPPGLADEADAALADGDAAE